MPAGNYGRLMAGETGSQQKRIKKEPGPGRCFGPGFMYLAESCLLHIPDDSTWNTSLNILKILRINLWFFMVYSSGIRLWGGCHPTVHEGRK